MADKSAVERSIKVVLSANTGLFIKGMKAAEAGITAFALQGSNAKLPYVALVAILEDVAKAADKVGLSGNKIGVEFSGSVAGVNKLKEALETLPVGKVKTLIEDTKQVGSTFTAASKAAVVGLEKVKSATATAGEAATTAATKAKAVGTSFKTSSETALSAAEVLKAALATAANAAEAVAARAKLIGPEFVSSVNAGTSSLDRLQAAAIHAASVAGEAMNKFHATMLAAAGDDVEAIESLDRFGARAVAAASKAEDAMNRYSKVVAEDMASAEFAMKAMAVQAEVSGEAAARGLEKGTQAGKGSGKGTASSVKEEAGAGFLGGGLLGSVVEHQAAYAGIGILTAGLASTIKITADFESQLATLGAITQTTATPALAAAGKEAIALGEDVTIANASASDAAITMQQLGRDGLTLAQSMKAAKASMQLAAAGDLTFIAAADDIATTLAQFNIPAEKSGQVADYLANASTRAKGGVAGLTEGLKYAGANAHVFGWNLKDTLATLTVLAKGGMSGSLGGTALKEIFAKLEGAEGKTNAAGKALKTLGITVHDANGQFVTAKTLTADLQHAHETLAPKVYASAVNTLFAARASTAANLLALAGTAGLKVMNDEIQNGAGVASLSEAKMSGLNGALKNLADQAKTAQVEVGEHFSTALQAGANAVAGAIPLITHFLTGSTLSDAASTLGHLFAPLVKGAEDLMSTAWPYVTNFFGSITSVLGSVITFLQPVAEGIGNIFSAMKSNGVVKDLGVALDLVGKALAGVANFLAPIGQLLGVLFAAVGKLPGPVMEGVVAFGLFIALRDPLLKIAANVGSSFLDMKDKVVKATASTVLSSVKSFGAGLLESFGNPVGLAIAGVTAAIGLFIESNRESAAAVEHNRNAVGDLEQTVNQTTGALTALTGTKITQQWVTDGVASQFDNIGKGAGEASAAIVQGFTDGGVAIDLYRYKISQSKEMQDVMNRSAGLLVNSLGSDLVKTMTAAGISVTDVGTAAMMGGNNAEIMQGQLRQLGASTPAVKKAMADFAAAVPTNAMSTFDQSVKNAHQSTKDAVVSFQTAAVQAALLAKVDVSPLVDGLSTVATSGGSIESALIKIGDGGKVQEIIGALGDKAFVSSDKFHYMSAAAADAAGKIADLKNAAPTATGAVTAITSSAILTTAELGEVGRGADIAADHFKTFAGTVNGITLMPDAKGGMAVFASDSEIAFARFNKAAETAKGEAEQFWFKMAGPAATAAQAADAAAAALIKTGEARRAIGANGDAVTTAKYDLQTAQDKPTGDSYSEVQKNLDIAAAVRRLGAAQDTQAQSQAGVTAADYAYGKQVADGLAVQYTQTRAVQGDTAARKEAVGMIGKSRQAYIDHNLAVQEEGMDPATATATRAARLADLGKIADAMHLIPTKENIDFIITGHEDLAAQAADIKKLADEAAANRTLLITAATADALRDVGTFRGAVGRMPAKVSTQFKADVALAATDGQNLYYIYDKTTGTWTGKFMTAGDADAATTAGALLKVYSPLDGTFKAILDATDIATPQVDALEARLDRIQDKNVLLSINTVGQSVTALPDGTFKSGNGTIFRASGGYVSGPGGPREDKIPAMLSNGEFVINARATAKHLPLLHQINKYANGGLIGTQHTNVKMQMTGNMDGALAAKQAIFDANDRALAAYQAQPAVGSDMGGVEQWRALGNSVFAAKGEALSGVQVMLNQMARESSGNPQAINLTDSNAQAGHPSVGLLQFIPGTFNAYADPGFNSDIYDPASQMRAFINYVNAIYGGVGTFAGRGYGPYANGGYVSGPGNGRSDSIPARLSNGEFVVNANSTANNRPLLEKINSYAAGGYVGPSAQSLEGYPGKTPREDGPRLKEVTLALAALAAMLTLQDTKLAAAKAAALAAADKANIAETKAGVKAAAAAAAAEAASSAASADANSHIARTEAAVGRTQAAAAASELAAEERLAAARSARGKHHEGSILAAEQHLAAVQLANSSKIAKAEQWLGHVREKELAKAAAAQAKSSAANLVAAKAATKAMIAQANYQKILGETTAVDNANRAFAKAYQVQKSLAGQADRLVVLLSSAEKRVTELQLERTNQKDSISKSAVGYDQGLTGYSAQRGTFDSLMRGQNFDAGKLAEFDSEAIALRKKGLSGSSIDSAVQAALGGNDTTLKVLSAASSGQIAQLNAVELTIKNRGDALGTVVADSMYGAGISAAQGIVKGIESQQSKVNAAIIGIANQITAAMKKALGIKSPSTVFHEMGMQTALGFRNGVAANTSQVHFALAQMVRPPNIPAASYVLGQQHVAVAPQIHVSIKGSDELTHVVASMIEVTVDGKVQAVMADTQRLAKLVGQGNVQRRRRGLGA